MFGEKGLVQVYTGDGKGKTTAALGLAMRTAGHGGRVAIVQFMKGWEYYGEIKSLAKLEGITLIQTGRPDYVYRYQEMAEDYSEARRGIRTAEEFMSSGEYDMLILDEINVALDYGLISMDSVIALIKDKPEQLELVITGRNAKVEIIELADLVTDMKEAKHPYMQGIQARKGIEF